MAQHNEHVAQRAQSGQEIACSFHWIAQMNAGTTFDRGPRRQTHQANPQPVEHKHSRRITARHQRRLDTQIRRKHREARPLTQALGKHRFPPVEVVIAQHARIKPSLGEDLIAGVGHVFQKMAHEVIAAQKRQDSAIGIVSMLTAQRP